MLFLPDSDGTCMHSLDGDSCPAGCGELASLQRDSVLYHSCLNGYQAFFAGIQLSAVPDGDAEQQAEWRDGWLYGQYEKTEWLGWFSNFERWLDQTVIEHKKAMGLLPEQGVR